MQDAPRPGMIGGLIQFRLQCLRLCPRARVRPREQRRHGPVVCADPDQAMPEAGDADARHPARSLLVRGLQELPEALDCQGEQGLGIRLDPAIPGRGLRVGNLRLHFGQRASVRVEEHGPDRRSPHVQGENECFFHKM